MRILEYEFEIFEYRNMFIVYDVIDNKFKKLSLEDGKTFKNMCKYYIDNQLNATKKEELEKILSENFHIAKDKTYNKMDELKQIDKLSRLEILLTNRCNMNCKYCYANGGNYGLDVLEYNIANLKSDLLSLFPNIFKDVDLVMFFGGEPLLNFEAIEATCKFFENLYNEKAISKIPKFTLITNGTLITDKVIDVFLKYNVQVTVSIDGDKIIHDSLRVKNNGNGTYDEVSKAIKTLVDRKVNLALLEVTFTSLHIKKGYTKEKIKNILKEEFGEIEILIVDCSGDSEYSTERHESKNDKSIEFSKEFKLTVLRSLKSNTQRDYFCNAGLKSFILLPSGDIYPCHKFIGNENYKFGSIRNKDIFVTEKYKLVTEFINESRRSKRTDCSICWARNLCTICPAQLLLDYKPNEIEIKCNSVKRDLKNFLEDLYEGKYGKKNYKK